MKQIHSWIWGAFEISLYPLSPLLFQFRFFASLAHSLPWVEIKDSLCPFILEYFFLISQFRFQLGNYILPISNSSVISIGYGILHPFASTLGVARGIVQSLLCSIPAPFHVSLKEDGHKAIAHPRAGHHLLLSYKTTLSFCLKMLTFVMPFILQTFGGTLVLQTFFSLLPNYTNICYIKGNHTGYCCNCKHI